MKSILLLSSLVFSAVVAQTPSAAGCEDTASCGNDEVSLLQTVSEIRQHDVREYASKASDQVLADTLKEISDKEKTWDSKTVKLTIMLKKGSNLKNADSWSKSDPYCNIEVAVCAGCEGSKAYTKRKSPYVSNTNSPVWNWAYRTSDFSSGDRVQFSCYDHDSISDDDLLGTATLPLTPGKAFDGTVKLQTKGKLHVSASWETCSGDCEDIVTMTSKMADAVYKFDSQAGSYHLVLSENIAAANAEYGEDHMALYKKKGSAECALAFSGSNDLGDWIQNLNAEAAKNVCGYERIHAGFLSEASNYFKSDGMVLFSKVINKICEGKVTMVGHSLGGAVATIVSACINSKDGVKAIPNANKNVVDFTAKALYTIGAPATSYPQMTDAGGKCFPGRRSFNYDSQTYDIVPAIANAMGYMHPKIVANQMFSDDNHKLKIDTYNCETKEAKNYPANHKLTSSLRVPSVNDHKCAVYIDRAQKLLR